MSDYELDGSDDIKPTPFDAHEQAVRDSSAYEHSEYPKAVAHVAHPSGVGFAPILVANAEEEAAYHESKAAEQPEQSEG